MTSPPPQQSAYRKWRATVLVASCLAPLLAACSGAAAEVQLPVKRVIVAPATQARQTALPVRQQVVAAVTGYTSALTDADWSRNPAEARSLLRPYLAADRIDGLVRAMRSIWATGEIFYGQDVVHVSSVTVTGARAFVHDCDNTSGMGLHDAATGQTVPGSAGVPDDNLVTRLDRVRGRWLVEFQLVEDVPCQA